MPRVFSIVIFSAVLHPGGSLCGWSLTIIANLMQVCSHRRARFFRVSLFDRPEDLFMVDLAAVGTARHAEDAKSLLPQQTDDGIEQG